MHDKLVSELEASRSTLKELDQKIFKLFEDYNIKPNLSASDYNWTPAEYHELVDSNKNQEVESPVLIKQNN